MVYFSRAVSGVQAGLWQVSAGRAGCVSGCEHAYPGAGSVRSCEVTKGRRYSLLLVFSMEVTKRQISTPATNGRFITC